MKNISVYKNFFLAVISIAIFAVSFANAQQNEGKGPISLAPTSGGSGTQNVKVVNTSAEPVPVTVNGTPIVTLSGTPTVQIGNTSANPVQIRDLDGAGRQPYRARINAAFGSGSYTASPFSAIIVPAGKRLVIKHATVYLVLPAGQFPIGSFNITDAAGDTYEAHFVLSKQVSGAVNDVFSSDQPKELYLDTSDTGRIQLIRDSNIGTGSALVTIFGYLVDVP